MQPEELRSFIRVEKKDGVVHKVVNYKYSAGIANLIPEDNREDNINKRFFSGTTTRRGPVVKPVVLEEPSVTLIDGYRIEDVDMALDVPMIATVRSDWLNSRDGLIETEFGQMIRVSYGPSFTQALLYWGLTRETFAEFKKTTVRVTLSGLVSENGDVLDDIYSDAKIAEPNDLYTILSLVDSIANKHSLANPEKADAGSGEAFKLSETLNYEYTVRYHFLFVPRANYQLPAPNQRGVQNYVQVSRGITGTRVSKRIRNQILNAAPQHAANRPPTGRTPPAGRKTGGSGAQRRVGAYPELFGSSSLIDDEAEGSDDEEEESEDDADTDEEGTSYNEIIGKVTTKIYNKKCLDIFMNSKAIIEVPRSEDEMCFPMAFMRCQQRTWTRKKKDDVVTKSFESLTEDKTFSLDLKNIEGEEDIVIPDYVQRVHDAGCSFLKDWCILVFDCTKTKAPQVRGAKRKNLYLNECTSYSEDEKKTWHWAAYQVHNFVKNKISNPELSPQNLQECLQAYSSVFGVYISMYSAQSGGKRIGCTWYDTQDLEECTSCINLLLDGSHMSAISHIRHYLNNRCNKKIDMLHGLCDFCGADNRYNSKTYNHQNKCFEEAKWKEVKNEDNTKKYECDRRLNRLPEEKRPKRMMCQKCNTEVFKKTGGIKECKCAEPPKQFRISTFCQCIKCGEDVAENHYNTHQCYMPAKKLKPKLADESLYVYDIEALQELCARTDAKKAAKDSLSNASQYVHEAYLLVLMCMYDVNKYWVFTDVDTFCDFILTSPLLKDSTVLGHNAGGYDNTFLISYLERNAVRHETVPRPNTLHKNLQLSIYGKENSIKVIDFMMMFPQSLKSIGEAFKLPVCKGDFPHRFSKRCNLTYNGPLPPLDHKEDYYCFSQSKSEEEETECREYWESQKLIYCSCESNELCTCSKLKWNFMEEATKYCVLDCKVLALAARAFREETLAFKSDHISYGWQAPQITVKKKPKPVDANTPTLTTPPEEEFETYGVDPFLCMTQSQIALTLFSAGKVKQDIAITEERVRESFRPNQIVWLENEMKANSKYKIVHAANSDKEWYDVGMGKYVDGYCPQTKTVFEYKDCHNDGCASCYPQFLNSCEIHPTRGITWKELQEYNKHEYSSHFNNNLFKHVKIRWSHDDASLSREGLEDADLNPMKIRDIFYGGRTEVFCAYCDSTKYKGKKKIKGYDVTSLYPAMCSHKPLPIGRRKVYTRLMNSTTFNIKDRLDPSRPDKYFGFVRARILPNNKDIIGILPSRIDGKLAYTLHEQTGEWSTEFVYLAMAHGYKVLDVYEVWDYEASEVSYDAMKGYMEFFLQIKQECEGWEKLGIDLYPKGQLADGVRTTEMEDAIMDYIFTCNGNMARPRREMVCKNPVKRQLAKIFLNCLWGKLAQRGCTEHEKVIHGMYQYLDIMHDPQIIPESISFRHMHGSSYKARYKKKDLTKETGKYVNVAVAATVTAHAQITLMTKMDDVVADGGDILYCDTDSIYAKINAEHPGYAKSGLGNWADEHPDDVIETFYAFAPKSYAKQLTKEGVIQKCKGIRSTKENRGKTKLKRMADLIESTFFNPDENYSIKAKTMCIRPNSTNSDINYGNMVTAYGEKKIRTVYSKRHLEPNDDPHVHSLKKMKLIRVVPFGYEGNLTHEYVNDNECIISDSESDCDN